MADFYEEFARPWPVRISKDTQRLKEIAALEARYADPPEAESFGPPVLVDAYEALAGDPSARLRRLAKYAARTLAPGLTSYLTERAPSPPPPNADLYSPGKMPLDRDPQLEGAVADVANIASNFVGPGGAAKAGATGGMKWLAMALPPGRRPPGLPMDKASRLARADEMGFRRNMPLYGATAPEGEQIAAAGIKVRDRVFTGQDHIEAAERAAEALRTSIDDLVARLRVEPIPDGFVTTSGRYVSRHEAADIAKAADQSNLYAGSRRLPKNIGLTSEDTRMASGVSHPETGVRIGATAPGLQGGGEGVWLSIEAMKPSEATRLWHRTANPIRANVGGRSIDEIHATLDKAWELGHDAVLLQNYTAPNGVRQSVIAVRDANQLRVPGAAFDPIKKLSRDLTAAIVPPVAIGAGADPSGVFGRTPGKIPQGQSF